MWRSSRQRPPCATSSLQAQLSSGPKARRCSGPRPRSRSSRRPAVPPCVTTTAAGASAGRPARPAPARRRRRAPPRPGPARVGRRSSPRTARDTARPPRRGSVPPSSPCRARAAGRPGAAARPRRSVRARGCLHRAVEVAGDDDARPRAADPQRRGRRRRPRPPGGPVGVQGWVELPLEAAGGVPLGPAVPPQHQPRHRERGQGRAGHRPAVSSPGGAASAAAAGTAVLSVNGMVGQSFHSRSRA